MIIADLHTHTNYSHGKNSVREMFAPAQAKGLAIQGFSEHSPRPVGYDYPVEYRDRLNAGFAQYLADVRQLAVEQAAKPDGVRVLLGLELDWLEREPEFMRQVLDLADFEYVIAGIHFLDRWGFDFQASDWTAYTEADLAGIYTAYYQTMRQMAESGLFQMVAHPDLIKIFTRDQFHHWLEQPGSKDLVRQTLQAVAQAGMALEISSAGLRKPCSEIYPCPQIMAMAAQLRLPVYFASDAHRAADVAADFDLLADYAAQFGINQYVVYFDGQFHPYPL